jgi:type II secretory pathway component PulF
VLLALVAVFQVVGLIVLSSAVRWRMPGLNRLVRMSVQSRVLRMLGVLIDVGKPVPESLQLLAASGAFGAEERRRLDAACADVGRGEPMAASLEREGLLRPAMAPLVQAAERARNLPWALSELGEALLSRLIRLIHRTAMVAFPLCILAIGLLVGFLVIGMFMPLVQLLMRLSE